MIPAMAMEVRRRQGGRARAWGALFGVLAAALCALGAPAAARAQLQRGTPASVPDEVVVQFEPGTSGSDRADAREAAGTNVKAGLRQPGLQVLKTEPGTSVPEAIRQLEANPDVKFAQRNFVYHATALAPVTPDDPDFGQLWGLQKIGAPAAWATTTGSPNVTVAVIDSGIAYDHPDLDGNIDSSLGRDFVDNDNDPRDLNGHGTHVAGTIAAEGNNGTGVAGVTWNSTLVAVRVLDARGEGDTSTLAEGIDYAGDIGAQVANVSISGFGFDQAVANAITSHPNTLYVVAAGNDSSDNDTDAQTPCNVDAPNLICVAATDDQDHLAGFSNTGKTSVDLGAPGVGILSTQPSRQVLYSWPFDSNLTGWSKSSTPPSPLWGSSTHAVSGWSATDSPGGNYLPNANTSIFTQNRLDLTGRVGCTADYDLDLDAAAGVSSSDLLRVMTDPNEDSVFVIQDSWTGSTQGQFVPLRTYLDSDGKRVLLRFSLRANADAAVGDGAYVDNVVVSCLGGAYDSTDYASLDGTSMATPHVTGTAALVWATRPDESVASVRCDLLGSGPVESDLVGRTVTGRRLDAAAAVAGTRSAVPPANTGAATAVTTSTATLTGTADPCGTASSYRFEFGQTTSYGSSVAGASIGAGNSPVAVSLPVAGMAPGTTYHYRLVTIRDGSELYGPDRTFTTAAVPTPPPPPGVTPVVPGQPTPTLKDVKVSCKRSGSGRKRTVTCTLKQASAVRSLSARLTKSKRLYAKASGKPPRSGRVRLKIVRRLKAGHYRLTLTMRDAKGAKRTKRLTVKV
jgi:subtilisin family serine protease